jgi:hypothetical protein
MRAQVRFLSAFGAVGMDRFIPDVLEPSTAQLKLWASWLVHM